MPLTPSPSSRPWQNRVKKHALKLQGRFDRNRRGLSWGVLLAGALAAAVALWPLAATVWDLLGLTSAQTWRLAAAGIGAVLLAAGVAGLTHKPAPEQASSHSKRSPVRLFWLILAAWTVAASVVAAMTGLAWLLLDTPQWQPPEGLTPKDLDAIATRAFAIVAGLGGVALLVISYRRQRTTEDGEEREVTKLFTETFDSAGDKLGSEHAAVRLAGVHALARLADDAPSGRDDLVQMVIDVLCAYLRMPYTPEPGPVPEGAGQDQRQEHHAQELEFAAQREVRHTILRIIGDRLHRPTRWRGKNYDFTGVVFDGADLSGACFAGGRVSFNGAEFIGGHVDFRRAEFTGGRVSFNGAEFASGHVDFRRAEFTGGRVSFLNAEFTGGYVNFMGAEFTGGNVDYSEAEFTGAHVDYTWAKFTGGNVDFVDAEFTGGHVDYTWAKFTGAHLNYTWAKFTGAHVNYSTARFIRGNVSFNDTEFTYGIVNYSEAEFTGGNVTFSRAEFTGAHLNYTWAKFTGAHVDYTWAKFTDGHVNYSEAEFTGATMDFRGVMGDRPYGLPEELWGEKTNTGKGSDPSDPAGKENPPEANQPSNPPDSGLR